MSFATLILAAGAGTRMKSTRAKVTHRLLDKPLVRWVVDAAKAAGSTGVVTVVGHEREQVIELVSKDTAVVVQEEQLGTGHAIARACDALCWSCDAQGAAGRIPCQRLLPSRMPVLLRLSLSLLSFSVAMYL